MTSRASVAIAVFAVAGLALVRSATAQDPAHAVPTSADGDVVIGLCDGETSLELDGVKDASKLSRDQGQRISDQLMAEWLRKNPGRRWDAAPAPTRPVHVAQAPSPSTTPAPAQQPVRPQGQTATQGADAAAAGMKAKVQDGHTYGAFSARDEAIWKASTDQFVQEGHRVFHDAKAMGGTVAISCDMCHPDASNTHPETYPKYQVQLGRVALLRDMINWCIENPVRGKPLAEDDPRLKAMEAYIYAQRRGVKLEPGKH